MMAPAPRLRKIVDGTSSMPNRARTTVMPLKKTARLAVCAGRGDGVDLVEAAVPLLAVAGDDEERVVDADREAHHRDHVGDEERELEGLAEQGGDADGNDDREDAEEERHSGRDERAEDEDQDERARSGCRSTRRVSRSFCACSAELVADAGAAGDEDLEALGAVRPHRRRRARRPMLSSASSWSPAMTKGRMVVWPVLGDERRVVGLVEVGARRRRSRGRGRRCRRKMPSTACAELRDRRRWRLPSGR